MRAFGQISDGQLIERLAKINLETVEEFLVVRTALGQQLFGSSTLALLLEGLSCGARQLDLIFDPRLPSLQKVPMLGSECRATAENFSNVPSAAFVVRGLILGLRSAVRGSSPQTYRRHRGGFDKCRMDKIHHLRLVRVGDCRCGYAPRVSSLQLEKEVLEERIFYLAPHQ